MRHPLEGAPFVASLNASIPVINAGDGGHCHPTQTLTDLLTISAECGRLDNMTVGFCGDLKYGRTVHSLINALSRYKNIKLVLISPQELKIPDFIKEETIERCGMEYIETASLEDALPELDILYMTRIQRERFADADEYERLKDSYVLTPEKMELAKPTAAVLHPLPRVNEISVKVDDDPRACYFRQVRYGKFIRMALILKLLSEADKPKLTPCFDGEEYVKGAHTCANRRCISTCEQELPKIFKITDKNAKIARCIYCESKISY